MRTLAAGEALGRVLVVDDNPQNRKLAVCLLEAEGFEISVAGDGDSALREIATRPPDLVLLDVVMPGPSGFEICRTLKTDPATCLIPVVLLTGLHDRERRIEGIRAGADDFVTKPFDGEELCLRVRSLVRIKQYTDDLVSAESAIVLLALTIEARDRYTDGHCQRLARMAVEVGKALGVSVEDLRALERGGYLHDVGKIALPDAILLKPGALTPEETAVMRQHPIVGERLCRDVRSLARVRPIIRHHHERRDGSGYPDGLAGDAIPVLAEVVGVVDVFDALTTDRPYRGAITAEAATAEILAEEARGQWRPDIVRAFLKVAPALS